MDKETLKSEYTKRYETHLKPWADELDCLLQEYLEDSPRIDRISVRAKSIDRFVAKAFKTDDDGKRKYQDPLNEIQDQIGARVITFYLDDVVRVSRIINEYFRKIEQVTFVPDTEKEFGYEGEHFILFIPEDIRPNDIPSEEAPKFFELQVKTLYQHAWGEASHDLAYKPERELSFDEKRIVAFTAAQSWGADRMFNELFESVSSSIVN